MPQISTTGSGWADVYALADAASTTTGFTLQLNQRNTVSLLSVEVLLGATVPVTGTTATVLVVAP